MASQTGGAILICTAPDAVNDLVVIIIALTMLAVTIASGPNLAVSYRHRIAYYAADREAAASPRFDRLSAGGFLVAKFLPASPLAGFSLRSNRPRCILLITARNVRVIYATYTTNAVLWHSGHTVCRALPN